MASNWRKKPACQQPEFGKELRDARLEAEIAQKELAEKVGISKSSLSHLENDGDRCVANPDKRQSMIDEVTIPLLKRRGPAYTELTRRRLLQLAFLAPAVYIATPSGSDAKVGWEQQLQEGLAKRSEGNHEEAKRLFKLVEHLGWDTPGVSALAIAHQAQAAIDLNERPSVTDALISSGLMRLGFPLPKLSESPKDLEKLLPNAMSRRAYAQLAKASGHRLQELQLFSNARASFRAYEAIGRIIDDPIEAERMRIESMHQEALLLTLEYAVPTSLDALAWSRVLDPASFRQAADLFGAAYDARKNDELGRAFDLRGLLKALHMLETGSSIEEREKRKIAARRQDVEESLVGWETKHPTFEGAHALLRLAAGRRARERGQENMAVDELEAAIEPGWQIRSTYVLADALGRLGEIYTPRPGDRLRAGDLLAASYAGWPDQMFSPDRIRLERQLRRHRVTVEEVQNEWNKGSSPSARLRSMPSFDESRALVVLRRVLAHN